ncbi:helix-turn-helix transcriptional regulator [Shewanella sp. SR44-4]|uniref:TetR/AcrR family transcriptional regulator n=3 Tax=Shewanella TaxID=22 RepID=UPI0012FED19E|nr:helix-turn-helix transcriptional regulator [Shewanella sp. SR44-4]
MLQAILDLMWQSSYGTLTIDAICERAGVKKGCYYFFKSKSEHVTEAILDGLEIKKPKMNTFFANQATFRTT